MILIDDMGWMDSAVYGSQYYDTPNLTRLSQQGVFVDVISGVTLWPKQANPGP